MHVHKRRTQMYENRTYEFTRDEKGGSLIQAKGVPGLKAPYSYQGTQTLWKGLLALAACGAAYGRHVSDRPEDLETLTVLTYQLLDEVSRQGDTTLTELMLVSLTNMEEMAFELLMTVAGVKEALMPAVWAQWWLWYLAHREQENPFITGLEEEQRDAPPAVEPEIVAAPPYFVDAFEEAVALGNTPLPEDYELAVDNVEAYTGLSMGVAWAVHEAKSDKWYSCYYNTAAGDMCCKDALEAWPYVSLEEATWIMKCYHHWHDSSYTWKDIRPWCPCEYCQVEDDPNTYLESMAGASDWESWTWHEYEGVIY